VVEAATRPHAAKFLQPHKDPIHSRTQAAKPAEAARITDYQATHVVLTASLNAPGLVVLNDTFARGWHAEMGRTGQVPTTPLPIHRTNGIMRGMFLPAGEFEIHMTYRPQGFYIGMLVSGLAWIGCLLYLIVHLGFHFIRRIGAQP
jgi:uncharacterized membrane protein YfhO